MDDRTTAIERAAAAMQPRWDDIRSERGWHELVRARRRRTARTWTTVAATAVAVLALLFGGSGGTDDRGSTALARAESVVDDARSESPSTQERDRMLQLVEGSTATPLSDATLLALEAEDTDEIRLRLDHGRARFDVVPGLDRTFAVAADVFTVTVRGTIFEVELEGPRIHVAVERGSVDVHGPGVDAVVVAGEARWFSPVETAPPAADRPSSPPKPRPTEGARAAPRWRDLARMGDHEAAWRALAGTGPGADDAATLMDAADTARLTGHPERAVKWLRSLLDRHGEDPLAPLATFTLGRILLDRLGDPAGAARAFARYEALAPRGALAQDALAREVEAWSKAGLEIRARERAEVYLRRHPDGRRRQAVRLYGGLTGP